MALDDRTVQEKLTPDERREYLHAFGDRMLIKVTAMDDPEDLPGVERCVRVAAVIERHYSRCDRAEAQAPEPLKLEAMRARHAVDAIEQRGALATTLKWGEGRRRDQGHWWDDAKAMAQGQPREQPQPVMLEPVTAQVEIAPEATILPTEPKAFATQGAGVPEHLEPVFSQTLETTQVQPFTLPEVEYVDYTDAIREWSVELGLPESSEEAFEEPEPPPPS